MPDKERLTTQGWLDRHPYLDKIARLDAQVEAAIASAGPTRPPEIHWDDFRDGFIAGTPALSDEGLAIDAAPAAATILDVVEKLASELSDRLGADMRTLADEIRGDVTEWLLGREELTSSSPGLLRYVGWSAMAAYLRPAVSGLEAWRDDERWMRAYCPMCGSSPAMAQLIGMDPGRRRLLVCGCCRTRWGFQRTRCPFCDADSHRLDTVTIAGEAGLRIDGCESCKGYLKTYDGEGNEDLLLSDWSSLHLDLIALDRGLRRTAVSVYDLGEESALTNPG